MTEDVRVSAEIQQSKVIDPGPPQRPTCEHSLGPVLPREPHPNLKKHEETECFEATIQLECLFLALLEMSLFFFREQRLELVVVHPHHHGPLNLEIPHGCVNLGLFFIQLVISREGLWGKGDLTTHCHMVWKQNI